MRQLLPTSNANETSAQAIYGDIRDRAETLAADRPFVLLNMVSSADGAIAVDGLSGGLSSAADKEVFFLLRSLADAIIVGAATARAENYGPPRLSSQLVEEREQRGQHALPRIAVVTRSMRLDWSSRLFAHQAADPQPARPCVVCPADAPAAELAAADKVADVITAGEGDVDLAEGLRQLAAAGAKVVLCEGGPTLNGQLLAAGLVDELCLTLSPALVGGLGRRISGWNTPQDPLPMELVTVADAGSTLLLRYAVGQKPTTGRAV